MTDLDVVAAQSAVEAAALHSVTAQYYGRASDPYADAADEYASDLLALAARDLVRAVDALPADQQPIGWNEAQS